jgi:hypothetical protein
MPWRQWYSRQFSHFPRYLWDSSNVALPPDLPIHHGVTVVGDCVVCTVFYNHVVGTGIQRDIENTSES